MNAIFTTAMGLEYMFLYCEINDYVLRIALHKRYLLYSLAPTRNYTLETLRSADHTKPYVDRND